MPKSNKYFFPASTKVFYEFLKSPGLDNAPFIYPPRVDHFVGSIMYVRYFNNCLIICKRNFLESLFSFKM
jgi:hypothetical protein